jgi:hypothetical protein
MMHDRSLAPDIEQMHRLVTQAAAASPVKRRLPN